MTTNQLPLLIFAQSARLLAQSATHAGYTVWVADCFLDVDTPADRKIKLPDLVSTPTTQIIESLVSLTQNQPCNLIYGSGIEYCPELLTFLPNTITVVGNTQTSLSICNSPKLFFQLLKKLDLPFPKTQFERPENNSMAWINKPMQHLGGQGIQAYSGNNASDNSYYQEKIQGQPASALFLASNNEFELLSINKQLITADSFLLAGIEAPFKLSEHNLIQLKSAINALQDSLNLKGFNSIDFIVDKSDKLFILEVNPRPSASMALINETEINLCDVQISSCLDNRLPIINNISSDVYSVFYYVYSPRNITVPANIVWPDFCSDIPHNNTFIEQGQPICSFFINASNATQVNRLRREYEQTILNLFN